MKNILIIDAGHGGVVNGKPVTAGKRSPDEQFIEGVFNRSVCETIIQTNKNKELFIQPTFQPSDPKDYSLSYRTDMANTFYKGNKCLFVSIHADAAPTWYINMEGKVWIKYNQYNQSHKEFFNDPKNVKKRLWKNEWHGASGISLFAYSQNSGNIITKHFAPKIKTNPFNMRLRVPSSTQTYWNGNFAVLKKTKMPAILIESGFVTNEKDILIMNKPEYRQYIADTVIQSAKDYFGI